MSPQPNSAAVRVAAVRRRLLLVTPIRVVLAFALLGGALAGDARDRSVVLAFVVGAVVVAFAALSDRRPVLLGRDVEPEPLPPDVTRDPDWRIAFDTSLPSTVGVAALAVIALAAGQPALGAALAGADAGLGLASAFALARLAAWERERGARLYVTPSGRRFLG